MVMNPLGTSSNKTMLQQMLENQNNSQDSIVGRSFGQKSDLPESGLNSNRNSELDVIAKIKGSIHRNFGDKILTEYKDEAFKTSLFEAIYVLVESEPGLDIKKLEKDTIVRKIMDDILGYGPIQDLIEDDEVTEIMVTKWDKIYAERKGILGLVPDLHFNSEDHLHTVIEKIVQPIGREINETKTMVDGRLPDGSRINAVYPPTTPYGATLSIRKFSRNKMTAADYVNRGSADARMLEFLEYATHAKCNMIVSGGTGSGKTTLLNLLSNYIPAHESIVTIEDSCELQLSQPNVRTMEARAASAEGAGEVTQRMMIKNALRMRPDRIVVGEIRDGVIVDLFRAMSSGHDGTLSTGHANSPNDCVNAMMPILFGMSDIKFEARDQKILICSSLDLIVQIERSRDGQRRISHITHVVGFGREGAAKLDAGLKKKKRLDQRKSALQAELKAIDEGTWTPEREIEDKESATVNFDKIYLQDIFRFKEDGYEGKFIKGHYEATGYKPLALVNKIESYLQKDISYLFEQK